MKIHHLGIIVKDINKNITIYENLGYRKISSILLDDNQNNKLVFLKSLDGSQKIELIEPINQSSSIYRFKQGYHHICYEVKESSEFIKNFKALRIGKIFTSPIIAPAINNRKVLFACLNNGTFIEFLLR